MLSRRSGLISRPTPGATATARKSSEGRQTKPSTAAFHAGNQRRTAISAAMMMPVGTRIAISRTLLVTRAFFPNRRCARERDFPPVCTGSRPCVMVGAASALACPATRWPTSAAISNQRRDRTCTLLAHEWLQVMLHPRAAPQQLLTLAQTRVPRAEGVAHRSEIERGGVIGALLCCAGSAGSRRGGTSAVHRRDVAHRLAGKYLPNHSSARCSTSR